MRRSIAVLSISFATHFCSHADPTSGPASDPTPAAAPAPVAAAPAPAAAAPAAQAIPTYRVPVDGLPAIGDSRALVTVVEFTDYQCPFCRRADSTVARLRAEYGDDLRLVVAERPLPMHDRARPAALAALAADAQGKLDALHGRLFALKSLDDDAILGAAKEAGLDMTRFDRDRQVAATYLTQSEKLADSLGVRGTPTFFVNGRAVIGAQPYDVFKRVVDEQLAAARAMVRSGVHPQDVYARTIAGGLETLADDEDAPGGSCHGHSCGDAKDAPGEKVEAVRIDGAPFRGSSRAAITVVEFADFECPYSAKAEATLKALEDAHPNDVRVVFKHRPLDFHDHSRLAAKASLAADAQGKFWPMHDRLFAAGASFDRAGLDGVARDLGMDVARFDRDLDDPSLEQRLRADETDADALKINGTPTFFVNGHRVIGAQPLAQFEAALKKD
jgi:protein-disulfide isomerase